MKKIISFLMIAAMAIIVSVSFTACSSDSDDTSKNVEDYQTIVDNQVKAQKNASKKNKALLLVAFGSTWPEPFTDFDNTLLSDDETTGIQIALLEESGINTFGTDDNIYNLNGIKVGDGSSIQNLPKGIYVVKGKKVIIK